MRTEERTLLLGALFHDIGKFEQRCTGNPSREKHPSLGSKLIDDGRFLHKFEKVVGKENIGILKNIISEHHNQNSKDLTFIVREADRLSASERVDMEEAETYQDRWDHKHLSSLFSKINILSTDKISTRYYKHEHLTKEIFDVIIPTETNEKDIKEFAYNESDWNLFKEDLEYVLDIYESDADFESLINLLLIIFEKYMWCVPDFTGSSETDISLYNHLKDVAALSHAIHLTQKENSESKKLNLVIGDIPGIQSYIFDVVNRKPAKILRGRSIFVQVLTRNLATKLLKAFGLTEVNLIMLAGGKFYIIAPDTEKFKQDFKETVEKIEDYLFDNFRMELGFNCTYHTFHYPDLMDKANPLTFGQLVEEASHKLIQNRYYLFAGKLFPQVSVEKQNFIWDEEYIKDDGSGSDSVKCRVTDKPIRVDRKDRIKIPSENGFEELIVYKQVAIEYGIGSKIVGNDLIAILNDDDLSINPENIIPIRQFKKDEKYKNRIKILLNPTFTEQLKKENLGKDVFRNTFYLEVANYCSRGLNDEIMPFEDIVKENEGAQFLALIKGDIDNLGLIMAYGLTGDKKDDLTAISRTTTLSNHLKYFFSFFLNGFLNNWEVKKQKEIFDKAKKENTTISDEELKKLKNENRIYTIFAGGDDLMLITPQSSAIKLIKALNDKFDEFTCFNREVHISYSVTHFKDHTPIRIVADFAEESQKEGKKYSKGEQNKLLKEQKEKAFLSEFDKAGTFSFNTFIKNENLNYLIERTEQLTIKAKDEKSGLSRGLIRRLLELSEMLKKYEETDDATYLIAYARLNYTVNRLLKDKDKDIKKFFENVLTINKEGNEEAQKLEKILHPLVCQVIYNIRK